MSIPVIDPPTFRLMAAGFIDPNRKVTGPVESLSVKEEAKQLSLILCELYGDTLDRMKLWDRIGSALKVAASKCDDGDTDRFAALCLEHVQAGDAEAARHQGFANWILMMETRDAAYRQAFVRHCELKTAIILVHARQAWESAKAMRAAAKAGAA